MLAALKFLARSQRGFDARSEHRENVKASRNRPWQSLLKRLNKAGENDAPMPTRNVSLTDTLDHFIIEKVKSGRYENASEVMRAALRALEREENEYEAKLAALRSAIDSGDSSGVARGDVFRRVRQKLGRIAKLD